MRIHKGLKMSVLCMSVDTSAFMKRNEYYLWYKGIYIKYLRKNKPDGSKDLNYTDSILSFANTSFEEKEIWRKMAECMRAWAYANNLDINLVPGLINYCRTSPDQIKKFQNMYSEPKRCAFERTFVPGTEFVRIANIDTDEKAELLRLYTEANSNFNIYFQILFFWHTIVYPSGNDDTAAQYINDHIIYAEQSKGNGFYRRELFRGAFDRADTTNIGGYIKSKIRHAIAHIMRHGHQNLIIDDIDQRHHLNCVVTLLKDIARYKLDNDYDFKINAPASICRLVNPDEENFTN